MSYKIIWQPNSELTFQDEIDFIFRKWNIKEVQNFINLVFENLKRLEENPRIGNYSSISGIHSLVISKQTTLYYSFDESKRVIDLHVFWNNQKNPEDLIKLL